jgi:hypothetical protein
LAELDDTIQEKLSALETKCVQIEDLQITIGETKMKKQGKTKKKYQWLRQG